MNLTKEYKMQITFNNISYNTLYLNPNTITIEN